MARARATLAATVGRSVQLVAPRVLQLRFQSLSCTVASSLSELGGHAACVKVEVSECARDPARAVATLKRQGAVAYEQLANALRRSFAVSAEARGRV